MTKIGSPDFLRYATILDEGMAKTRSQSRSEWQSSLGMLAQAGTAAKACIGSILSRPDRAYPEPELEAKLRRAALHTNFLQGLHAVDYCLAEASYAQAATLVRTEIETVGALHEVRMGRRIDGKTPNIFPLRHLGKIYSQFTALAHVSNHGSLANASNPQIGNIDHVFNPSHTRHIYGSHLSIIAAFALDLADFRPESDERRLSIEEDWHLSSVFGVLVAEGFLIFN